MAPGHLFSCLAVFIVASFIFSYSLCHAQFPKKEKFHAVKEDVEHVRCETCRKAIKYLSLKTHDMREENPAKKVLFK